MRRQVEQKRSPWLAMMDLGFGDLQHHNSEDVAGEPSKSDSKGGTVEEARRHHICFTYIVLL
jgi:hypothetical protein